MKDIEVNEVVDALLNPGPIRNENGVTKYYRENNWFYFNESESSFFTRVVTEFNSYGIHLKSHRSGNKKLVIIVEDVESSFQETLLDPDSYYESKYYTNEEEHFMDSTIEDIAIPFEVMRAVEDFCKKYHK